MEDLGNWYPSMGLNALEVRKAISELIGNKELSLGSVSKLQFNKTDDIALFTPSDIDYKYVKMTVKECEQFVKEKLQKTERFAYFCETKTKISQYGHLIINQDYAIRATDARWIEHYQYFLRTVAPIEITINEGNGFSLNLFNKEITFHYTRKDVKNGVILRKVMKSKSLFEQIKYLAWLMTEEKITFKKELKSPL